MFYISVMIILCDYYRYTPFDINTRFALLRDTYDIVFLLIFIIHRAVITVSDVDIVDIAVAAYEACAHLVSGAFIHHALHHLPPP